MDEAVTRVCALHLTGSVQDAEDIVQGFLHNILSILDTASQVEREGIELILRGYRQLPEITVKILCQKSG